MNECRLKSKNTVHVVASLTGVKEDYVRKVRSGERCNELVMELTIEYEQRHSKLIQELVTLVPLEKRGKEHLSRFNHTPKIPLKTNESAVNQEFNFKKG